MNPFTLSARLYGSLPRPSVNSTNLHHDLAALHHLVATSDTAPIALPLSHSPFTLIHPPTYTATHASIYPSTHLSIYPFICPPNYSSTHPTTHPPTIRRPTCPSVQPSIHPLTQPGRQPPIHSSVHSSISPSICSPSQLLISL